jgi:5-methylcytosine-specific restriction endonuclease McrA
MQQYQRKHRTRILALRRQWRQKNPDKISASTKSRRYQSDLMVKSLTPSEVSARNRIYLFRDFLNLLFPLTGYLFHVDHIVPLARGGTEHPDNLQILRDKENLSKGCKLAHEASLKPLPVPESFSGLLTMKLYSDLSKEVEIVEVYHLWIQHIKKYYDEHEIPDQDHPEEVVATQDVVVNQTVTVDTVTVETLVA